MMPKRREFNAAGKRRLPGLRIILRVLFAFHFSCYSQRHAGFYVFVTVTSSIFSDLLHWYFMVYLLLYVGD